MSTIDQGLAAELKSDSLVVVAPVAGAVAWGDRGRAIEAVSPFYTLAGAQAEAARVAAFFGAPLVQDKAVVRGAARAFRGRCITLTAPGLGYAPQGELVFVLGVAEQADGTSILSVLKRLS